MNRSWRRCLARGYGEGAPSLGRRSASLDHVLRDAGLRDFEAELEQLAMMRGAPHNGFSALTVGSTLADPLDWPAPKRAGFPPPVPAKAGPCHRTRVICCVLRPGTVPDLYYNEERPHGAIGQKPPITL